MDFSYVEPILILLILLLMPGYPVLPPIRYFGCFFLYAACINLVLR